PPQLRSRLLRARQRVLQGVGWRLARPRHVPRLDGEARDGDPHPLGVPLLHRRMSYTPNEIMTVEAARRLANGTVCFVGIGLPSAAANLARLTHAPDVVLIYESGTIGAKPEVLPLSIGDGELAEHADTVVSVPEIFRYWLQGGRVDVGFLGAAQVDRFGNINTTVIGNDYAHPKVRLPGAGGAPEIASNAKETWIIIK